MTFRFFAQREFWSDYIAVGIGNADHERRVSSVAVLTFAKHEEGAPAEPTLRLRREEAVGLMDELWAAGVRPSSGEGNAGQLGATEKHLADMRRIAFASVPAATDV